MYYATTTLTRVALVCLTNLSLSIGAASAESAEVGQPIDEMLAVFDKTCFDVFVRHNGDTSIDEAFHNVGLTAANASYRLDPARPVIGYVSEEYAGNGINCMIEFASGPEQETPMLAAFQKYNMALPGLALDKKLSSLPPSACLALDSTTSSDEADGCDIHDHLLREFNGTKYLVELAQSDVQGPYHYALKLKFDFQY